MREPLIRTVTGDVAPSAVNGFVLPHEHLRVDTRWGVGVESDPARWLDEEQSVIDELRVLHEAEELGLVIDQTCLGMGRDAVSLTRIAASAKVAVVASTGLFTEPFNTVQLRVADAAALTDHLLTEIFGGLDGTNVLPGVIGEVGAWGAEPTPGEEQALRAAARAGRTTGLPVSTYGGDGLTLLEIVLGEGLDGSRVAVGCSALDPAVLRKIAEAGAYVSLGTLGMPLDHVVRAALTLIEEGHAERLLLSTGICRVEQLRKYGGAGFAQMPRHVLPALRDAGVDEATLHTVTRANPLRWLTLYR
ncbi:aryldialkylphosphatase [Sinosporangium siamense]|uniref:Hydrolase n=1 Tax=Sinosporangium siamense TaxID=1367973 RepID=A0A919RAN5_9ACTN|nr:aryldialkylphosphatase [Sinosporangium siamense]GII90027.1 hydrolase [Sinosporangium siamense]